jgi:hypothetical protein
MLELTADEPRTDAEQRDNLKKWIVALEIAKDKGDARRVEWCSHKIREIESRM